MLLHTPVVVTCVQKTCSCFRHQHRLVVTRDQTCPCSTHTPVTDWCTADVQQRYSGPAVSTDPRPRSMALQTLQTQLSWLYSQYLLVTAVYMLEPWERALFTSVLLSAAAMVGYYVFLPVFLRLALHFFSGVFGGQEESAVTLMS
ncbi:unnamed protein product [Boreogadus saida]